MRSTSFVSAVLAMMVLGSLGVMTLVDLFDGPGSPRQERVARTPDLPDDAVVEHRFFVDERTHLKERYALKDTFVALNGQANLQAFNRSPTQKVALGSDRFLFLSGSGAVLLSQGRGRLDGEQTSLWRDSFAELRGTFNSLGMGYGLLIGPNKHTIFPEKLPSWVQPAGFAETRTHDIMGVADEVFGQAIVDTRTLLTQARAIHPDEALYHPTDTHWTELGAALAVREALGALGEDLPAPQFDVVQMPRSGDLSRMIGQQQRWVASAPELPRLWTCRDPQGQAIEVTTIDPIMPRRFSCGSPTGRDTKLVVVHDSFGVPAIPYIAQHFQHVEFIWTDAVDPAQMVRLGADIVLHIIVERKLIQSDPARLLLKSSG